MNSAKLVVAQIGSRQFYEPAVTAYENGNLARLITDFWIPPALTQATSGIALPKPLRRLVGSRTSLRIPTRYVKSLPAIGLVNWFHTSTAKGRTRGFKAFAECGQRFARGAERHLDVDHGTVVGYTSECLEILEHSKKAGIRCTMFQIDPARSEEQILIEEEARFPQLVRLPANSRRVPGEYFERVGAEWDTADRVIVNSQWTASSLLEQGVPKEKLSIVPLLYERSSPLGEGLPRSNRLRVLWLGTLCLRKGFPYAIEAAQMLRGKDIAFTFAGGTEIPPSLLRFPGNCKYIGHVPRSLITSVYGNHDVFLLPTLSDGFALTQVEAMSHGLPVIATPCCGDVVNDWVNGFLVPPRDASSIVDRLLELASRPALLEEMSSKAIIRSRDFTARTVWPLMLEALTGTPVS